MILFLFLQVSFLLVSSNRIQFMKNFVIPKENYTILNYSMPTSTSSYDETAIIQSIEFRLVIILLNTKIILLLEKPW